jgi:hypothetical protein
MNQHDAKRFARAISAMAATFRQEATEALFEGYRLGLEGIPIDAIERAIKRAIQGSKFMPSAAELRELAGDMLPADRAVKAFSAVETAYHRHVEGPSLDFDDRIVNATIRNMGGWEAFTERWEQEGRTWTRKEFERIYVSLCRSGVTRRDCGYLIGFHERSNRFHGYRNVIKPPLVIECGLPPAPVAIEGPGEEGRDDQARLGLLDGVGRMPEGGQT